MSEFEFSEYRNFILRSNGIDGIRLMWMCERKPLVAGKMIYKSLVNLYDVESIDDILLDFKSPMHVYDTEEVALWKYLESCHIRKEDLINGKGSVGEDH